MSCAFAVFGYSQLPLESIKLGLFLSMRNYSLWLSCELSRINVADNQEAKHDVANASAISYVRILHYHQICNCLSTENWQYAYRKLAISNSFPLKSRLRWINDRPTAETRWGRLLEACGLPAKQCTQHIRQSSFCALPWDNKVHHFWHTASQQFWSKSCESPYLGHDDIGMCVPSTDPDVDKL